MILLGSPERRNRSHDLALGGTTAITAGMVNVCSVMAFFAFSSNVTGHVAVFTEEIAKGHWHQVSVVIGWLFCFLMGAVVANTLVHGLGRRLGVAGRAAAPVLQVALLLAVGTYCQHHYAETLRETEILVAVLLFTMGLQNSTVASISGGVVKTTHVTGLFTELGMELALLLRGVLGRNPVLTFKLTLHLTVLGGYLFGGVVGGLIYLQYKYAVLFLAAGVLASALAHDLIVLTRPAPALVDTPPSSSGERDSYQPRPAE